MSEVYPTPPKKLRDLNGLGPRSEEILADVDIHTVEDFMAIDPYDLYAKIKPMKGMGLNSIYAIIGARENLPWLEVANTRKVEILMRLDDLGLGQSDMANKDILRVLCFVKLAWLVCINTFTVNV